MKIPDGSRFIGDEDSQELWWFVSGTLLDFSVAHTYVLKMASVKTPDTAIFQKTTGFAGAAGSGEEGEDGATPNLVVTWATSGEINLVTEPGRYLLEIVATKTADSTESTLQMTLNMRKRLGAVPSP